MRRQPIVALSRRARVVRTYQPLAGNARAVDGVDLVAPEHG